MIRITAKHKNGFRRCGLFHRPEPVEYADDRFSDAELAILTAEPMIRVELYAEPLQMEEPFDLLLNIEEVEKPVKVEPPKRGRPRKY